jgi:hypothetical protein
MRAPLPIGAGILVLMSLAAYLFNPFNTRVADAEPRSLGPAISCSNFLNSLGVNTHVSQGYNPGSYVLPLRYLGVRNIRDSGLNLPGLMLLHNQTGVRIDLLGFDVTNLIAAAKILARAGALLSIEGPNEPNNFPITYGGVQGGGTSMSWLPVANLQRDIFAAVKQDPELQKYPVFHVSEGGAETDNVGLQFLAIPKGATTLLPAGTEFADYANVHNYVSANGVLEDNQAWQAADPTLNSRWDGLFGEYGVTWKKRYQGYSRADLLTLPRVTTETGWDAPDPTSEDVQGKTLVNTYLAQFKRGWSYTFIYQLGEGEGGGGSQGLFHANWTPKLAAKYIHNLTSILADDSDVLNPQTLDYVLVNASSTVHDLLLQKSGGIFELVVWGESVATSADVTINFGKKHAKVRLFDTTISSAPINSWADVASVTLPIGDHAMVIEIQ